MSVVVRNLAILGQGLIGSSITRAAGERGLAATITVTDASDKVRRRVIELGIGGARVADSNIAAVRDADLVIACVPVGQMGMLAGEIANHLKPGAILSDVGSVKEEVVRAVAPALPAGVAFVPAHPLAGTEHSGPDHGLSDMFVNRWCILTPPEGTPTAAVETVRRFWEGLGARPETMTPSQHDHVLAITSHIPHLIAFSIFHTALRFEEQTNSEVMKFSAGGFRDFTRIASSNPTMWRDIFLANKDAVLAILRQFNQDVADIADAIEKEDGEKLLQYFSKSRITRRKVIEKEHISVVASREQRVAPLIRPYGSDD